MNKVGMFLMELEDLCKKYNVSISHEDIQGAFVIETYKKSNIEWILNAVDNTKEKL